MLLNTGDIRLAALAEGEDLPSWNNGGQILLGDNNGLEVKTQSSLLAVSSRTAWAATTVYAAAAFVRPTAITDLSRFVYEATTAGTSAAAEPVWPVIDGATIADGTVVWTARRRILSVPIDSGYPTRNLKVMTYRGTITPTEGNFPIEEWGVADSAGLLLNRKVTAIRNGALVKTAQEIWKVTLTLTLENP